MVQGKIHHWKHGWIPISPEAKAWVAGGEKGPRPGGALGPKISTRMGPKGSQWAKVRVITRAPAPPGDKLLGALKKDGGFTYNPKAGRLVKVGSMDGVAVARPGTERIVGKGDVSREDFANAVADVIMKHPEDFGDGAMLGGWYSEDRDAYMVEVTDVFPDRQSAIKAGRDRNQEGIFDLKTGDYIPTGGTGDGGGTTMAVSTGAGSAVLNRDVGDQVPTALSSFSAADVSPTQLVAPSTGPGQRFWPEGVPAIKDVGVFNAAEGERLADAWKVSGPLLDRYAALEPSVTPDLVSAAAGNGGYMMGLTNKLKTRDSLARKLYQKAPRKGLTPSQYAAKLGDTLRYTMVTPPDKLATGTQGVLDRYRKRGYTVEVENTWGIPNATYRGINTNVTKDGMTFEIQFHTPESFDVKTSQHGLYDIARSNKYTPEQRAAANAQMEKNMAALAFPPGIKNVR